MHVVVVSGLPCSGKTTLLAALRAQLAWPALAKDEYKELLFANLGSGDRAWSRRLGAAAYAVLFAQAEQLVRCGLSCIIEGNFRWRERAGDFARLHEAGADFVQLHCSSPAPVLIKRYRTRAAARHPGHVDLLAADEIEAELSGPQTALPLAGKLFEIADPRDPAILATLQALQR
jgi:predicted kinase